MRNIKINVYANLEISVQNSILKGNAANKYM